MPGPGEYDSNINERLGNIKFRGRGSVEVVNRTIPPGPADYSVSKHNIKHGTINKAHRFYYTLN